MDSDFTANNRLGIARFANVRCIHDTHLVRQNVPLLKGSNRRVQFTPCEPGSKL